MDVILTQDIEKLGEAGDVVKVKPGYGRNYLLPRGMAMLATEGRVKELQHKRRVVEDRVRKEVADHSLIAKQLDGLTLEFEVKVGEEGKLFGSVTNADIWSQLTERGFKLERRKIDLGDPIKQVGEYDVKVKLHREVSAAIRVKVFGDGSEPPAPEPDDTVNVDDEGGFGDAVRGPDGDAGDGPDDD
ncbi:MAG: 50S ribosomal protein L9 [Deltaproteobacteria bacterium]|nr:50S ribosomal protein L9 [Deltaproteobacteria bacterium]MBW2413144.1 50S ribosomal protein L9 [Deltaproteobacteria bacterium]